MFDAIIRSFKIDRSRQSTFLVFRVSIHPDTNHFSSLAEHCRRFRSTTLLFCTPTSNFGTFDIFSFTRLLELTHLRSQTDRKYIFLSFAFKIGSVSNILSVTYPETMKQCSHIVLQRTSCCSNLLCISLHAHSFTRFPLVFGISTHFGSARASHIDAVDTNLRNSCQCAHSLHTNHLPCHFLLKPWNAL